MKNINFLNKKRLEKTDDTLKNESSIDWKNNPTLISTSPEMESHLTMLIHSNNMGIKNLEKANLIQSKIDSKL